MPDFRGKRNLARWLLGKKIKKHKDLEVSGRFGCSYLVPNLEEIIGFELFVNGVFELDIISFLIGRLPQNGVLLDLGANIGAIALPICKERPDATVICVEASPFVTKYLKSNLNSNRIVNARIIEGVLSDKAGEKIDFYFPDRQFGKGAVTNLFHAESLPIDSVTIDELIEKEKIDKVNLIKMDIEGYEYFALKGGSRLLEGDEAPPILFEFVDYAENSVPGLKAGSAQSLLRQYGYELFHLMNGKLFPMDSPITGGFAMIWAVKPRIKK